MASRRADPSVSNVAGHPSLSLGDGPRGWRLVAPPGVARVEGRPAEIIILRPGTCVELPGGLVLRVDKADRSAQPLRFLLTTTRVEVSPLGGGDSLRFQGPSGRVVRALLGTSNHAVDWNALAAVAWPKDAALRGGHHSGRTDDWTLVDERRFRNRWDRQAVVLRRRLGALREGLFHFARGEGRLDVQPADEVVGV